MRADFWLEPLTVVVVNKLDLAQSELELCIAMALRGGEPGARQRRPASSAPGEEDFRAFLGRSGFVESFNLKGDSYRLKDRRKEDQHAD